MNVSTSFIEGFALLTTPAENYYDSVLIDKSDELNLAEESKDHSEILIGN